ncbi:MAG: hypothetical protein LUI05_05720 [Oscillospiraceae bacterium]|nr:hypothetical protein [Oscillospiraceae bacterium]
MEKNDSRFDDVDIDSLGLDEGGEGRGGHVPRFERDLAKAGSLAALSQAKKAENEQDSDGAEEESPFYQYHTKPDSESGGEVKRSKSFADFAREAEEEERRALEEKNRDKTDHSLDDVKVSADMLSDMGYNEKKRTSDNIRHQMEMDSLAMEMGNKPVLEEMSTEYNTTQKRTADLASRESLDRDEKQLIKERLEKEIGKRPTGYNKKASVEMYHTLMKEQKIKRAKKGFFVILMLAAMGIIVSVITYTKLNWNDSQLFMYLAMGTLIFSLLMILKARVFKFLAGLYFAVNTVLLAAPGLFKFAFNTSNRPDAYIETLVFYIVAIALSAIICIQLCTSSNIDTYYTTHITKEKKSKGTRRK